MSEEKVPDSTIDEQMGEAIHETEDGHEEIEEWKTILKEMEAKRAQDWEAYKEEMRREREADREALQKRLDLIESAQKPEPAETQPPESKEEPQESTAEQKPELATPPEGAAVLVLENPGAVRKPRKKAFF